MHCQRIVNGTSSQTLIAQFCRMLALIGFRRTVLHCLLWWFESTYNVCENHVFELEDITCIQNCDDYVFNRECKLYPQLLFLVQCPSVHFSSTSYTSSRERELQWVGVRVHRVELGKKNSRQIVIIKRFKKLLSIKTLVVQSLYSISFIPIAQLYGYIVARITVSCAGGKGLVG